MNEIMTTIYDLPKDILLHEIIFKYLKYYKRVLAATSQFFRELIPADPTFNIEKSIYRFFEDYAKYGGNHILPNEGYVFCDIYLYGKIYKFCRGLTPGRFIKYRCFSSIKYFITERSLWISTSIEKRVVKSRKNDITFKMELIFIGGELLIPLSKGDPVEDKEVYEVVKKTFREQLVEKKNQYIDMITNMAAFNNNMYIISVLNRAGKIFPKDFKFYFEHGNPG